MTQSFDLVILGTGAAATSVASPCALRDQKKVPVGAADLIDWTRRMAGKGIEADGAGIDWPALMRFKRTFTEQVPASRERAFPAPGIAAFDARARFMGPRTLSVGDRLLQGALLRQRHWSRARTPAYSRRRSACDQRPVPRSGTTASKDRVCRRRLHRLRVRSYCRADRGAGNDTPLRQAAARAVRSRPGDGVLEHTRSLGMDVQLESPVEAIESSDGQLCARVPGRAFAADLVLHAAVGRPEIEDLDLPAGGVEFERRGVCVNQFLQSTSSPAVYAAGDCAASGPALIPVASYEGGIMAHNLLDGNRQQPDYTGLEAVVYTIPPRATTRLQEHAARRQGLRLRVNQAETSGWYSPRNIAEETSAYKVLVEEGTECIVGAHVLGQHAGDVINLFARAIRRGLKASQMRETIYAYPSDRSDVRYML